MIDLPVTELLRRLRARELSPVELLETHIGRLEAVNPLLNAVIATRLDAAREEARRAEARYAAGGELPPLLGVPCTIKEFLRVEGMPHTGGGVPRHRDQVAWDDAVVVQRLRAAGAVVVGVTNVPEGGMWMETYNTAFGRTHNPWDLRRTPGGSSGGEAAAVASGAVPFGIGSDIGGSIRIPAAFCGIFGHKPSGFVVPNTGHWPDDPSVSGYLCTGPMGRSAADLWAILQVIAGPDPGDPGSRPFELEAPDAVDPRELTVYALPGNGRVRVWSEMRFAVARAAAALHEAGAHVVELSPRVLHDAFEIWAAALTRAGSEPYAELLGMQPGRELWRLLRGTSEHTAPAVVTAALERLTHPFEGTAQRLLEARDQLQAELETLLGPRGVLLHPPYTRPAPRHIWPMLTPLDFICTGIFNALQMPATVAPVGLTSKGLPLAVQVVGRRGADGLTIAAAGLLERAFGGWSRVTPRAI